MLALPLVALLGQVAKVDIRTADTLTSEAVLKALLQTTYAGAGLTITGEHMTVMHAAMTGAYVIEVSGTSYTNEQVDGYWCMNDPALRNGFKDLAVINTGLTTIDAVHTCVGASGEPCASSTVCGSGGGGATHDDDDSGGGGTEEPEPESGGGGDTKKKDDDDKLSTVAIVFIVLASLVAFAILVYLLWPWIETCWKRPAAQGTADGALMSSQATTGASIDLPPLYSPA